jgi:hypothetical protein
MPGAPKSDLSLQAADGPTKGGLGSGGGLNAENSLFNKHYNKELKLCEGKSLSFLTVNEQMRYQWFS